jgi:hypothetical protein
LAGRSLLSGDQATIFSTWTWRAVLSIAASWARRSRWSLRSVRAVASGASRLTGRSIRTLGSRGSWWSRLSHALALRWNWQQFLFLGSIFARCSLISVPAWIAVATVGSGLACRSRWSTLAGTARGDFGVSLTFCHTHEGAERCLGTLAGASAAAAAVLMDVQHLLPHVTRTCLAEFDFALHAGLQRLHVVEDEREGQQACGHGHRAEHDRNESDHAQRRVRVHFGLFHMLVFAHSSNIFDSKPISHCRSSFQHRLLYAPVD